MSQWPTARPPKKTAKTPRAPRPVATHVFIWSPQQTHDLQPLCDRCGHPRNHRVHDLNVVTEDVSARVIGEGSGE